MQPIEVDKEDENYKAMMKNAFGMNMIIIMIFLMLNSLFWYFNFHIFMKLGVLGITIISLYYQLTAYKHGIPPSMIETKLHERKINEVGYQASKRGYKVLFEYTKKNSDDVRVKFSTIPKGKKKYIKWISMFHVLIKPAWGYREFDEEDEIDEVLNESWYEVNQ